MAPDLAPALGVPRNAPSTRRPRLAVESAFGHLDVVRAMVKSAIYTEERSVDERT